MDYKRHCVRLTPIQTLPEEVLQLIFSHLVFDDKCRCCLVCTLWNKVLRCPEPGLWKEILLDLALVVRRIGVDADRWQDVCKWFAFRSGGIQKVKFRAVMTLEDDSKPIKELVQVLNEQFAFLAGAVTWKRTPMYLDLSFKGKAKGFSQPLTFVYEGSRDCYAPKCPLHLSGTPGGYLHDSFRLIVLFNGCNKIVLADCFDEPKSSISKTMERCPLIDVAGHFVYSPVGLLTHGFEEYLYVLCRSDSLCEQGPHFQHFVGPTCAICQEPGLEKRSKHNSEGPLLVHLSVIWAGSSANRCL